MRHACQVHERALRGARRGIRAASPRDSTTPRTDVTRTLLLGGTAGVGVTRFLDEAIERMRALREPMTVLRASAWPASADEPYGPIVRAIGPALRDLPADDARRAARSGHVRGHPAAARPRAAAGRGRRPGRRRRTDRPGTAPGANAGGDPRPARPAGRAASGRPRHRGPPSGRCRDAGAHHVPGADLARTAAGDHRHPPARRRRPRRPVDDRPRGDHGRSASAGAADTAAARSRRAGRPDRGDRG